MFTLSHIYQGLKYTGLNHTEGTIRRLAYSSLLFACGCSSGGTDSDTTVATGNTSQETAVGETKMPAPADEPYIADNDIAMKVRSVADAINVGEPIDSTEYNFSGVLTDGMGAPLFTDFEGFPGQWEVDVISSNEVKIRNIAVGDLLPGSLMEYLSAALDNTETEERELRLVDVYDRGDTRVEKYVYGQTTLKVETSPAQVSTGEVGPMFEITLHTDTID